LFDFKQLTGKSFNRLEIKDDMDQVAKKINCIFSPRLNFATRHLYKERSVARGAILD